MWPDNPDLLWTLFLYLMHCLLICTVLEAYSDLFVKSIHLSIVNCCSSYVDVIEQGVVAGDTVLIENLEETIDPIIDPLLGRHTIKKGR